MLLARGMSREGELSQRAIAVAWQRDCRSCLKTTAAHPMPSRSTIGTSLVVAWQPVT